MKKVIMVILLMVASVQAQAAKLYMIDMTGKKFASSYFNTMDDGIVGSYSGFGVKLSGLINKDFTVATKASLSTDTCSVKVVQATSAQTVLEVLTDVEVDGGETCKIGITYKGGAQAVLTVESIGG